MKNIPINIFNNLIYSLYIEMSEIAEAQESTESISETKEIAEQSTGKTCTKYTEENPAHIGLKYDSSTLLFEQLAAPSDWDGITPEMPN